MIATAHRRLWLAVICLGLMGFRVALAQDATAAPQPGKQGYNAFDPTPTAQLRAFCTDRPTKSTSPCTVDAGHFQLETDLFNVTVDRGGGQTTTTWLASNPTLKFGLTTAIDVEANVAPYVSVTQTDRASGARSHVSGVGDLFIRAKWALLGDDGGAVALAISPFVKLPTASHDIGNGAVEGGLIAPININLPAGWSLVIDPEVDVLRNAADDGRHLNIAGLLSFSRGLSKTLTASAELWSATNFDPQGTQTQISGDVGLAYVPAGAPDWQWDGGVNFGLNRQTPAAQAYVGLSRRF